MPTVQYDSTDIDAALADLARVEATLRAGSEPPPPPPPIVVPDFFLVAKTQTIIENASVAQFECRLSESTSIPVSVRVRTINGTALAGQDFTPLDVIVTFNPGETVKSVNVNIINDTAVEANESFSVVASEPVGLMLVQDIATVTIQSDDVATPTPTPPPPSGALSEDIPPAVSGDVARFGGSTYSTLSAGINATSDGGVCEILPGQHVGAKAVPQNVGKRITLRGIVDGQNRRPFLNAQGISVAKGIVNAQRDIVIERLGFMYGRNGDNGTGLFNEPGCNSIIARWCLFTLCDSGIRLCVENRDATYTFEDCVIINNGWGTQGRGAGAYIAGGGWLNIRRCSFRGQRTADELKTRTMNHLIEDSEFIQAPTGSYAIDISNGGNVIIRRCKVIKPTTSQNQTLIAINPEGPGNLAAADYAAFPHSTLIEDSILDNQRSGGIVVKNDWNFKAIAIVRNCQMPHATAMSSGVRVE